MNTSDQALLSERKFSELCSVLGVTKLCCLDPDRRVIEKAFRRTALKCHPDKGGDPVVFKRLNDAYYKLIGHILKLQQQSELLELSQSILIEVSCTSVSKWQEKLRTRYGWFKSDNCKHIIFDGPYKQFMGRSKNTGNITVVLYEDPPDQIPKIHIRSRKYMAWIAENALPVHLHVDKGRALQFDQWRIVHLAEFGICNFSEVSPSSFNKPQRSASSPKVSKRRKAQEESDDCSEVKHELCHPQCSEANNSNTRESGPAEAEQSADTETQTVQNEKRFVCSTCGEDFVNMMSLNFHRNSCVPEDLYDEFPSDIVDNGDKYGNRKNNQRAEHMNDIFSMKEEVVNNCDSSGKTPSEDSSCLQGLSAADNSEEEDNPDDEIPLSKEKYNCVDERQETLGNREGETNVKFEDKLELREGNVNNGGAESGPGLHSYPPLIDSSGAEGLAKTDNSQIINTGEAGQEILNNQHCPEGIKNKEMEDIKENSVLRVDRSSKLSDASDNKKIEVNTGEVGQEMNEQCLSEIIKNNETEEAKEKSFLSVKKPSKLPKTTNTKIEEKLNNLPERSAFKKDVDLTTLKTAQEIIETNPDEISEISSNTENKSDIVSGVKVELHCDLLVAVSISREAVLGSVFEQEMINRTGMVTAIPRRERNMDSFYASYNKPHVLSANNETVSRQIVNDVEGNTKIINILEQEKVEKKLRELELNDIGSDYRYNENFNERLRHQGKTRDVSQKLSVEDYDENRTRKIVLSNTEVNKNRPKLLGPSRFGY